jgi:D-alanyl-D-alanine carboxypeptidase
MKKIFYVTAALILLLSVSACGKTTLQTETAEPKSSQTAEPVETASPAAAPELTAGPKGTPAPALTPEPTSTPAYDFVGLVVSTAADYVNIRQKASTDSEIIGQFPGGEEADVIEYDGSWVNICYNGTEGYVHSDFTIASSSPSVEVPAGDWAAILVNQTNLLPDDFTVGLADFEGGQVDARILEIATAMFEDAAEDGIEFTLVDAYRSFETQEKYYEAKVKTYIDKGYSREAAEAKASTITARPNTSEHQAGLALDIVTPSYTKRNSGYADTQAFKWMYANAYKYGFIMRYPRGKEDITKVIFEPWHWRFVGVKAAAAMKKSGQCYEEYLGILN